MSSEAARELRARLETESSAPVEFAGDRLDVQTLKRLRRVAHHLTGAFEAALDEARNCGGRCLAATTDQLSVHAMHLQALLDVHGLLISGDAHGGPADGAVFTGSMH